MIRKCDICGTEADEHRMESYNIGAKTIWMCWGCYKQSQYEATKSDMVRQKKLYQIHNARERNR